MKQILIATHGKMASGIRYTAELIVGQLTEITTIDAYVTPEDNVEEQFKEFFEKHKEDRIIVFTDLMGGSVNQKLMEYAKQDNVTLVTGTNLPVLMQVMLADDDVSEEENFRWCRCMQNRKRKQMQRYRVRRKRLRFRRKKPHSLQTMKIQQQRFPHCV